jgi:competence protein ComEA
VVGKVRKPGIVTVPKGSRVFEAIAAAGGLKGNVDTTAVNMARLLTDGEQILIGTAPATVPGAAAGAAAAGSGAAPAKINLNTATAEQLDTLPGVGPVTAQSILSWRTENGRFTSVEDLLDVKGIGDATLAELRDHVTV